MKRVIPILLLKDGGVCKSIRFKKHKYVGDPLNIIKIFSEKEVDEIVILDISNDRSKNGPNFKMISEIAGEAFMPLSYGGGLTKIDQVKEVLYQGVEKVIFNTSAFVYPQLISETAYRFGSSSTVVSIDVKKNIFGKNKVFINNGTINTGLDVLTYAKRMVEIGAGELVVNSIDRDGTLSGYDLLLVKELTSNVSVPVIASGGAKDYNNLVTVINEAGAAAAAAGSIFIFQGIHRAVLPNYPDWNEIQSKMINYGI